MSYHSRRPVDPDVRVSETHYDHDRRNSGPFYVGLIVLSALALAALFWMFDGDDERPVVAHDTDVVVTESAGEPDRDAEAFLESTTIEVRDLRSDGDLLARNATSENLSRIQAYQDRVSRLEERLAENRAQSNFSRENQMELERELESVRSDYAQLEAELATTREEVEEVEETADRAAITAEIENDQDIRTSPQATPTVPLEAGRDSRQPALTEDVEVRLEALEQELESLSQVPQAQAHQNQIAQLESELSQIEIMVDGLQSGDAADDTRQEIERTLASIEQRVRSLSAEVG